MNIKKHYVEELKVVTGAVILATSNSRCISVFEREKEKLPNFDFLHMFV